MQSFKDSEISLVTHLNKSRITFQTMWPPWYAHFLLVFQNSLYIPYQILSSYPVSISLIYFICHHWLLMWCCMLSSLSITIHLITYTEIKLQKICKNNMSNTNIVFHLLKHLWFHKEEVLTRVSWITSCIHGATVPPLPEMFYSPSTVLAILQNCSPSITFSGKPAWSQSQRRKPFFYESTAPIPSSVMSHHYFELWS